MCSSLNANLYDTDLLGSFDGTGLGVAGVGIAGVGINGLGLGVAGVGINGIGVAGLGVGVAGIDTCLDGLLLPTTLPAPLPACIPSGSSFNSLINSALNAVTVRSNNSITRARRAQSIAAAIRNLLNSGRGLNSTQRGNVIALLRSALNRGRIAGQLELLVDADLIAVLDIFRANNTCVTNVTTTNCGCASTFTGF